MTPIQDFDNINSNWNNIGMIKTQNNNCGMLFSLMMFVRILSLFYFLFLYLYLLFCLSVHLWICVSAHNRISKYYLFNNCSALIYLFCVWNCIQINVFVCLFYFSDCLSFRLYVSLSDCLSDSLFVCLYWQYWLNVEVIRNFPWINIVWCLNLILVCLSLIPSISICVSANIYLILLIIITSSQIENLSF